MKSSICSKTARLHEVLKAIDVDPAGIAFIVDAANKLCGVMTDGDVRRLLLAGRNLGDSIEDIPMGDFVYARQGEDISALMAKTNRKVRIIPIVNEQHEVVDYFRYDQRVHVPVAMPDLAGNELKYVSDAVLSTWVSSSGVYLDRFEQDYAAFCGTRYAVTTFNGTVALHLALAALGVGPGDEVIVPDFTFAATLNAVLHAGATPVVVDVETESWGMDPAEFEGSITERTKAVIPVHIYGQPCNMDAIMDIARRHKLFVVEDAAEAHGAEYGGQKVGSIGDIGCFSFYGNKVITTGEGGMCITDSEELQDRMRVLRDHGMNKQRRYWHDHVGYNYRMTNLQAALGCAQLERIESILAFRQGIEDRYRESLADFDFIRFQRADLPQRKKITWLVSVLIEGRDRDALMAALKQVGVDARPFFYSMGDMDIYKPYAVSAHNSKAISAAGLSLPTHKDVDFGIIRKVVAEFARQ